MESDRAPHCNCLFCPSIISSKFTHVVTCVRTPFFFKAQYYILPEKAMAAHSSTLAWKIPWMEESDRLPSMVSQRRTRLKRLSSSSSTYHICLCTHPLVDSWVLPSFDCCKSWCYAHVCRPLFSGIRDICPEVGVLADMVILTFLMNCQWCSTTVKLFYIPTHSAQGLQCLHILAKHVVVCSFVLQ